jgi:ACR3 family arsenite efflux pump ArsB
MRLSRERRCWRSPSSFANRLDRRLGVAGRVAGLSNLIGAPNFFEFAVATAIALLGVQPRAALAAVVGVLIDEVLVMLPVVHIARRARGWRESATPDSHVTAARPRGSGGA